MSPKGKTGEGQTIRYLTQDEVRAFFAAIPKEALRDRVLFAFIYRFGMRATEACELPTTAVNRSRGEVTIVGKKGGLTRTYSLPRDLLGLLKVWKPTGATFFAGRQGGLHRVRVWQLFKQYAQAAGLPGDYGVHSLRHSAAVHALDAGLATEDVRDLLRHKRLSTTDVYANLSTRRRNDYLARLQSSNAVVKIRTR